jgi:hypothetical protein
MTEQMIRTNAILIYIFRFIMFLTGTAMTIVGCNALRIMVQQFRNVPDALREFESNG